MSDISQETLPRPTAETIGDIMYDGNPAVEAVVDEADLLNRFARVQAAKAPLYEAGRQAGLLHPPVSLRDGLAANMYTQPRVASFSTKGIVEKDIVKVKTMAELTEDGELLQKMLRNLGHLSTKEIGDYRVFRPLLRRLSLDELPQLAFNVLGLAPQRYPDLLPMKLWGAARPLIAPDITITGDNANTAFGKIVEDMGKPYNLSAYEMYNVLGQKYEKRAGLFTPAHAGGDRQSLRGWAEGILAYDQIMQLPPLKRRVALACMTAQVAHHIIKQTDAV